VHDPGHGFKLMAISLIGRCSYDFQKLMPEGTAEEAGKTRDISFDHFDPAGKVKPHHQKGKHPSRDISALVMSSSLMATTPKHTDKCHHNAGNVYGH